MTLCRTHWLLAALFVAGCAASGCQAPSPAPISNAPAGSGPVLARVPAPVGVTSAPNTVRVVVSAGSASVLREGAGPTTVAIVPGEAYLIDRLYAALAECGSDLTVVIAANVRWRTVLRVLYTAGQAGAKSVHLEVAGSAGVGHLSAHFPSIALAPRDDAPDAESCVSPTVHVAATSTSLRARWSVDGPLYAERALPEPAPNKDLASAFSDGEPPGLGSIDTDTAGGVLAGRGGEIDDVFGELNAAAPEATAKGARTDPPGATNLPLAVEAMGVDVAHRNAEPDMDAVRHHLRALRGYGTPCLNAVVSAGDDLTWGQVAIALAALDAEAYQLVPAVAGGDMDPATGIWPELWE